MFTVIIGIYTVISLIIVIINKINKIKVLINVQLHLVENYVGGQNNIYLRMDSPICCRTLKINVNKIFCKSDVHLSQIIGRIGLYLVQ